MGEKIETLHTEGKQGRSIDKTKYETIREAVLACFDGGELTHAQLNACVEQKVRARSKAQLPGTPKR
jgi:hypothetical protein